MYTYDVYLKNRLTEIDVTITHLLQREIVNFNSLMYIYTTVGKVIEKSFTSGNARMFFDMDISKIEERLFEKINFDLILSADADLIREYPSTGKEVKMKLLSDKTDLVRGNVVYGNSFINIFTSQMQNILYQLDIGKYDIRTFLDFTVEDLEQNKTVESVDCKFTLRMQRYRILEELDDFKLEELDDKTLEELYWAAIIPTYCIMTEFKNDSKMSMLSEANVYAGHYRLLCEMDDMTLEELDDMTLHEVDFVKNSY